MCVQIVEIARTQFIPVTSATLLEVIFESQLVFVFAGLKRYVIMSQANMEGFVVIVPDKDEEAPMASILVNCYRSTLPGREVYCSHNRDSFLQ
jgi:hypothetical protein